MTLCCMLTYDSKMCLIPIDGSVNICNTDGVPQVLSNDREKIWENEADPGPEGDGTDGLQLFGDRCSQGGEPG